MAILPATAPITTRWSCFPSVCAMRSAEAKSQESPLIRSPGRSAACGKSVKGSMVPGKEHQDSALGTGYARIELAYYLFDPDGHQNELYYGIEQIGWNGHSKPRIMYDRGFDHPPELPQISEQQEVQEALAKNVDLLSGYRHMEKLPAVFEVDGISLPRPFKIVRLGPVYLFVENPEAAESFYRDVLGFTVTEEIVFKGHRCLFLRCNTEHHSLALFPLPLRDVLGLSSHSKCASFGLQVANYRQLRDAVKFLRTMA